MCAAQLAWIDFVGYTAGSPPDRPVPGPTPPGIWGPTDPRPTHPIVIPPDALAPGVPTHPIYLPPYPSQGPGFPTHPIVIPPGSLAPGKPTHPIYLPVYPTHPIVIPPDAVEPGVPTHPIVLPPPEPVYPAHPIYMPPYPSQGPGFPTHPIVIPPDAIVPDPGDPAKAHVVVYAQTSQGVQRITFTVELPPAVPPTEATPRRS
jgi:hypothetical protein